MKLLFLHGLGQNKDAWYQTIHYLGYSNIECPDLISAGEQNQTFSSIMNTLESKFSKEDDSLILCGLSIGAILAIEFYLRHPEKVESLILIAPQYKIPTWLIDLQNIIFRFMPRKLFSDTGTTRENMISISSSIRQMDYGNVIKCITCPVSVICGEKDRANRKAAISLNSSLPDSELTIVEGARHEVNIDTPEKLAEIIRKAYKKAARNK